MYEKNPLSPHLQIYRWHLSMILSITHRIIGVVNSIAIILICLWTISLLFGEENYEIIKILFQSLLGKLLITSLSWSFSFHMLSEIRHLIWDLGYGFDLKISKITGVITIIGSLTLTILIYLLGENFICTYYAAQCSLAGSRGQSLHLDYPYVVYNKPGDKIPMGMGSTNHLLSCGILTYLNNSSSNSYGPIVLRGSQKYRRFPTVQDVKKYKFTKLKVPKGGMVILNTLMWHAGAPNYSDKNDRSVLVTHYTPNYVRLRMDLKNTTKENLIKHYHHLKEPIKIFWRALSLLWIYLL